MAWTWYLFFSPLAVLVFFWIYRNPFIAIYAIILSSSYNVFWGELKVPVVKIAGVMLFIAWLIYIWQGKINLKKLRVPQTYLILILIVIAYLSSLFSADIAESARAATRFVFLFFLYASLVTLITNRRQIRGIIWALVLSALINMGAGFIKVDAPWSELLEYRIGGLTLDPNQVALYIVTILPLVFYLAFLEKPRLVKTTLLFLFAAMTAYVVLSFSRGGFLGLILVWVLLAIRFFKKPFYLTLLIFIAIAGFVFAPVSYKDRIRTILYLPNKNLRVIDGSLDNRFNYLSIGFKKLFEAPILGIGLDRFKETVPLQQTFLQQVLHNSYLEIGVEMGLFGLAVFLMLIWETIRYYQMAKRAFARARSHAFKYFSDALFISFIAFAFGAMFLSIQFAKTFWILMAFSVFLYKVGYNELKSLKRHANTFHRPQTAFSSFEGGSVKGLSSNQGAVAETPD